MKRILSGLLITGVALSITSCGVTKSKGVQSSPVISRSVQLDPIKADIIIDENQRLKGESSSTYFLAWRITGDDTYAEGVRYSTNAFHYGRVGKIKSSAAYKALESGDYDVLVHPTYFVTVEKNFFIHKYTVVVEGYGAKYANYRTEKQKIIYLDGGTELILQDND